MRAYEKQTVSLQDATDHGDGDNQTYLRVAEIVLSKALSPLKAREIVDRGIDQGLFGDHVMSRTPEKSMQARLSTDILTRAEQSRFARTSKGRFTLRSKLARKSFVREADAADQSGAEYHAERRILRTPKEEVLCVKENSFSQLLTFQGIDTDPGEILRQLLQNKHLQYVGRSEAETRDDAKQFVTYVLVQCGQRLLFFKRSYLSRAAEFLRGSKCIGFGGHVSAADMDILSRSDHGLSFCARRELSEELRLPDKVKRAANAGSQAPNHQTLKLFQDVPLERLAVLNDDSSEVGRRHVAVVYRAWLSDWAQARQLQKGDSSIKGIGWIDLSKDTVDIAEYEYWSQLCLRRFYPSTVVAKAKFEILNHSQLTSDRIIAVSGRIGSGKSETASYLSEKLKIPLVKTGTLLAKLMSSPSITEVGREEFQARALRFILDDGGPDKLAAEILRQANALSNGKCIVDGIRNLSTYEKLTGLCQGSVALLFVQAPADLAYDMYRAREAQGTLTFSYRDFLKIYDAPVEAEILSLGRRASAVIYNSFGLESFRRTLDLVVETLAVAA